jgi:hypothetical protein
MSFPSRATLGAVLGGGVALSAVVGAVTAGCSSSSAGPGLLQNQLGIRDDGSVGFPRPDGAGGTPPPDGGPSPGSEGGSSPGFDGAPDVGADGASGAGSDDASDGASPDVSAGACNGDTADGPLVEQTVLSGSQPAAMGGHIYSGTYWLTERDTYGGTPDGLFVQRSLVIDATTVNLVGGDTTSDAGMPVWATTTSTYEVLDLIVLSTTESCPGPAHVTNVQFTAAGGQLTLYPTSDTAEVYTLQ